MSLAEILGALTTGATVVIAPPADLTGLGELIDTEHVTHIFTTPTLLSLIPPGDHPSVRHVITAGEPARPDQVHTWSQGERTYINAYGPAETTIVTTAFTVPAGAHGQPPIGRPLPNTTAHPLDHWGAPTPVGVPGELHLGGINVTDGYLNRPELTTERFTDRGYRTGDIAMWTPDHQLAFLGRADAQVKINGLRIEPGEIEHALTTHPAVTAAAVAPTPDGTALTGYIVADDPPGEDDLRAHLEQTLPSYMVPAAWVRLDALPRTANGKLDRKALPAPERATATATGDAPPQTALEHRVAEVFADLLGLPAIGRHGNFFTLGGTSLQAIQATARLTEAINAPVSLRDLYTTQTVAALAAALDDHPSTDTGFTGSIVELRGGPAHLRPLWCVHAVSGSPYSYHPLGRLLPDRTVYGLEAPGLEGDRPPVGDLSALAAGYAAAIRERQPEGPYLLAGWSMGGFVAFEVARLLRERGAEVGLVAMLDSADPGPYPRPDEDEVLRTFAEDLASTAARPVPGLSHVLALSGERARLTALRATLVEAGLIPGDVSEAFALARYRVFRANMLAMYAYRPAPADVSVVHIQATGEEPRHGWEPYATGGLRTIRVDGDHYTMWAPENLGGLAAHLSELLTEADPA